VLLGAIGEEQVVECYWEHQKRERSKKLEDQIGHFVERSRGEVKLEQRIVTPEREFPGSYPLPPDPAPFSTSKAAAACPPSSRQNEETQMERAIRKTTLECSKVEKEKKSAIPIAKSGKIGFLKGLLGGNGSSKEAESPKPQASNKLRDVTSNQAQVKVPGFKTATHAVPKPRNTSLAPPAPPPLPDYLVRPAPAPSASPQVVVRAEKTKEKVIEDVKKVVIKTNKEGDVVGVKEVRRLNKLKKKRSTAEL
jgi:hypothetical protein